MKTEQKACFVFYRWKLWPGAAVGHCINGNPQHLSTFRHFSPPLLSMPHALIVLQQQIDKVWGQTSFSFDLHSPPHCLSIAPHPSLQGPQPKTVLGSPVLITSSHSRWNGKKDLQQTQSDSYTAESVSKRVPMRRWLWEQGYNTSNEKGNERVRKCHREDYQVDRGERRGRRWREQVESQTAQEKGLKTRRTV